MGIRFEDYKEEPKNENLGEDEFISRLDGSIQKKNGRKTTNELYRNPQWVLDGEILPEYICKGFQILGDCFRMNDQSDPGMVKYLYNEWRFPKNIIDLVFHEFGESFDESQKFLMLMDSSDGDIKERMRESWDRYCDNNDIHTGPSTDEFAEFIL